MADDSNLTDARTPPSEIWKKIGGLRGAELDAWRMADVTDRPSADDRNLTNRFAFGWWVIEYADELGVGEVKPIRAFGQDLVLWRGEDGVARVIGAYCAHYGANMAYGGKVHGNLLECPFHAWRYDEQGAVQEIPYARNIPPQARKKDCVPSWPTTEANGFIYVWYHPKRAAPMWQVETIAEVGDPDWAGPIKFDWQVFTSVENAADNGVDIAHFQFVHGTTNLPEYEIKFDGIVREVIARAKLGTPKGVVDGVIASRSHGPGEGVVRFSGLSETILIAGTTPVDRDHIRTRWTFYQPRTEVEGPSAGLARALIRDLCKQYDQDKVILDRHRRMDPPLICDGDGPFGRNRTYYSQFLASEPER